MRGPEKVGKDLTTNAFFLELINGCSFKSNPNNYFKLNPVFQLGKQRVVPSFEMKIMIDEKDFRYYVGDKYDNDDLVNLYAYDKNVIKQLKENVKVSSENAAPGSLDSKPGVCGVTSPAASISTNCQSY